MWRGESDSLGDHGETDSGISATTADAEPAFVLECSTSAPRHSWAGSTNYCSDGRFGSYAGVVYH